MSNKREKLNKNKFICNDFHIQNTIVFSLPIHCVCIHFEHKIHYIYKYFIYWRTGIICLLSIKQWYQTWITDSYLYECKSNARIKRFWTKKCYCFLSLFFRFVYWKKIITLLGSLSLSKHSQLIFLSHKKIISNIHMFKHELKYWIFFLFIYFIDFNNICISLAIIYKIFRVI